MERAKARDEVKAEASAPQAKGVAAEATPKDEMERSWNAPATMANAKASPIFVEIALMRQDRLQHKSTMAPVLMSITSHTFG